MMQNIAWKDLSAAQQAVVVVAGVAQFGLLGAALADLSRRPAAQINGSKPLWSAAVFINFFGPLAYFARGRRQHPETNA